jgi:hypothetical protein
MDVEDILKNEATFGFDQDGELFFLEGIDLKTGNFGDELLNFLDFWRRRTEIGKNVKSLNLGLDQLDKKRRKWSFFSVMETVFMRVNGCLWGS